MAHEGGMLLDDMERPVLDPIAERNHAAHKDALLFGGSDLVPDAFARDFALELAQDGEVFLKVDPETQPAFSAAGSTPFVYSAKGKPMPTSFWRFPPAAYDEPNELVHWAGLGLKAARRAAAAKGAKKPAAKRPLTAQFGRRPGPLGSGAA